MDDIHAELAHYEQRVSDIENTLRHNEVALHQHRGIVGYLRAKIVQRDQSETVPARTP